MNELAWVQLTSLHEFNIEVTSASTVDRLAYVDTCPLLIVRFHSHLQEKKFKILQNTEHNMIVVFIYTKKKWQLALDLPEIEYEFASQPLLLLH